MIGPLRRAGVCGLLSLFCLPSLVGPALAGPDDLVPRGSVAYDLLGSLAAAARLSGYRASDFLRGDRLFTRREVARILAANAENLTGDASDEPFVAVRRTLFVEFAPELAALGLSGSANSAPRAAIGESVGSFKVRGLSGPAQGTGTLRLAATFPVGRDGIAILSGGNYREEWYRAMPGLPRPLRVSGTGATTGPTSGFALPIVGAPSYPAIETAYVRVNGRALDVSVGVLPLRWGPGYTGGMLLSDAIASLPQIRIEKTFRVPGTFGRRLGPLAFTQVYGQFFEADDPSAPENARGTRRHLSARRLETAGDGRFRFSVGEAFKSTRLPGAIFSQILPYYQYQNDWTTSSRRRLFGFLANDAYDNTNWLNYLADVSLTYRADGRGTTLYADYVLDDIKAPFRLGNPANTTTPRKLGQQYGVFLPDLGGVGRYALRLEYVTTDRETYSNYSPPAAWDRDNLGIGHPFGPNARVLFGRAEAKIGEKARVSAEFRTRRRGATLAGRNEPNLTGFGLYGSYDLRSNLFLGGRYENERLSPQSGTTTTQSRFEANLTAAF
ncbi:MAG: capsule assembly Wzi family protein [Capsulimonadales bacterium]|nr:capsule assembly Wzi family protein [Capsulimonadales bacterium]